MDQPRLPRLLCLHGSRQDATLFSSRTAKLARRLAGLADLVFAEGPVLLPLEPDQQVAMRCWWADEAGAPEAWTGAVRSSMEALWAAQGPFDGVLGFSQARWR